MLDLLHLDELDELVSIPCQVLVVKQSCLLHRNYFICHRMHQKNASWNWCDVIDVGEVVLLELDVAFVFVVEHARQWPYGALQDSGLCSQFCSSHCHRVTSQTEPPKNHLIERPSQPGQNHLQISAYHFLPDAVHPRLPIAGKVKCHIFSLVFVGEGSEEAQRIAKIWRISVGIDDAG